MPARCLDIAAWQPRLGVLVERAESALRRRITRRSRLAIPRDGLDIIASDSYSLAVVAGQRALGLCKAVLCGPAVPGEGLAKILASTFATCVDAPQRIFRVGVVLGGCPPEPVQRHSGVFRDAFSVTISVA